MLGYRDGLIDTEGTLDRFTNGINDSVREGVTLGWILRMKDGVSEAMLDGLLEGFIEIDG